MPLFFFEGLIKRPGFILSCIFLSISTRTAWAQDQSALTVLTGKDLTQLTGLGAYGLDVGGWATSGFTYNPSHPGDRSNGTVQFNDRANEFHLYQLGLFVEKPIQRGTQNWQLGGRFEFMFGTD